MSGRFYNLLGWGVFLLGVAGLFIFPDKSADSAAIIGIVCWATADILKALGK